MQKPALFNDPEEIKGTSQPTFKKPALFEDPQESKPLMVKKETPLVLNPNAKVAFPNYSALIKPKKESKTVFTKTQLESIGAKYKPAEKNIVAKKAQEKIDYFQANPDKVKKDDWGIRLTRNMVGGFEQSLTAQPKAFQDVADLWKGRQLNADNWTESLAETGTLLSQARNVEYGDDGSTFSAKLGQGVGQMVGMLISGGFVGKGAGAVVKAVTTAEKVAQYLGKSNILLQNITKIAPNIAQRTAQGTLIANEASMEMGQAYEDILAKSNGNVEKANKVARNVLITNGAFIGLTNRFSGFFEAMPPTVKGTVKRVLGAFFSEGTQESGQSVISNLATGKKWYEGLEDGETFLIGGIIGSGASLATADIFKKDENNQDIVDANGKKEIDMEKVKDVVAKVQKAKVEIQEMQDQGATDQDIVDTLVEENGLDEITAKEVLDTVKKSDNLYESFEDATPEEKSALVSDVKMAIEQGSRISAISKAIQDQYGVSEAYANNIVATAMAEQEVTDVIEPVNVEADVITKEEVKDTNKADAKVVKNNTVFKEDGSLNFDEKTGEMNAKQLVKAGFGEEAMGYGEYADIYKIKGKPVVAYRVGDSRPYPITGISVQENYRKQGIAEQFLREFGADNKGVVYVQTPNEDMMRLLKRIGKVSKPDGEDIVTVTLKNKEEVSKEKPTVDTPVNKEDNKNNDKTIQRTIRNKRTRVSKPIPDSNGETSTTGETPDISSEEVIQRGRSNNKSTNNSRKSNGKRSVVEDVPTEAKAEAEALAEIAQPEIDALNNEIDALEEYLNTTPEELKAEVQNEIDTAEENIAEIENKILDKVEVVTNEQIAETIADAITIDPVTKEVSINMMFKSQMDKVIEQASQYKTGGETKQGRGILDEYYTDKKIVDAIYSILNVSDDSTVLEPSIGTGNFVPSNTYNVDGYEINSTTAGIAKILNNNIKVFNTSFESNFIDDKGGKKDIAKTYDLVIGNPPYGEHRGLYKGLGEEKGISKYEEYFIKRSLDVTKVGGKVVLVVPSSFLKNQSNSVKQYISSIADIEVAFRLPEGSFAGTSIGTDIIVFNKTGKPSNESQFSNNRYFAFYPENILGQTKERRNRFGDTEEYVEGNLDDAISQMNALNIEKIAVGVAKEVGMEATKENIDTIKEVMAESETNNVVETIKESEKENKEAETKQKTIDTARTKKIVERIKKSSTQQGVQINLGEVQNAQFTPTELEHWKARNQDGSLPENFDNDKSITSFFNGKWYMDFSYLQGNVYEKLEQLEKDKSKIDENQYNKQKKALEAIKPKPLKIDNIKINANSSFMRDFKTVDSNGREISLAQGFIDFVNELPSKALGNLLRTDIRGYVYNESVRGGSKDENARVRKYRSIVSNELLLKYFEEIAQSNPELTARIEDRYNQQYNAVHIPDYSEVPLTISINNSLNGKPFEITSVQQQGIGRLVEKGVGILAHDVGFGKTLTTILATYQTMQNGHAKKPLFVVPKATYNQWIKTTLEVIPNAKVNNLYNLADGYKGDLSSLKINDGEFNFVTEEGFKRLSFKDETYDKYSQKYAYVSDDLNSSKTTREAEKDSAKSEENKGKMIKGSRTDLYFEDLGFDLINIDEVHNANNIITKIKMPKDKATEFRSISKPANPSIYGVKAWLASQYIQDTNNGKNVYLASATPFTNSPMQYFSVLSLVANKTMRDMGVDNINDFLNQFMDIEVRLEYKPNGTFSERQVIRNFKNFTMLRKLLGEFIDFKSGEDNPDLIRPVKDQRVNNFGKSDDYLSNEIDIQTNFGKSKDTLKLIGQLRALSISSSLLKDKKIDLANYKEIVENSPKLYAIAKNIGNNQRMNKEAGRVATEIVYSPIGVEIFPVLKQYLINEEGMKAEEIGIITGDTKTDKRTEIQNDFNGLDSEGAIKDTKLRVLMGTDTIGTGLNLQKRTSDIHFLGLPWNFTDLTQVEGRAWRQGNKWASVRMNHYLMENSYDAIHFQILTSKQKRYELAIKNNEDIVDVGDVDIEKQLSELITDPQLIAEIKLNEANKTLAEELRVKNTELSYSQKKIDKIVKLEKELESFKTELERAVERFNDSTTSEYMKGYYEKRIPDVEKDIAKIEKAIEEQKQAYIDNGLDIKEVMSKIEPLKADIEVITSKMASLNTPENKKAFFDNAKNSIKPVKPFETTDVQSMIDAYSEQNKSFYTEQEFVKEVVENEIKEVAVEKDNKKKVFYHGTLNKFDKFSMDKAGENTGWENAKFGIFFLEDKQRAIDFIEDNRTLGEKRPLEIKEVYLDIKNPLDLTTDGIFNNEAQAPVIYEILSGEKLSPKKALKALNDEIGLGEISDMYDDLYTNIENKKIMKDAGYDGIVSSFGKDDKGNNIKEWVAFDVEQIEIIGKKETKEKAEVKATPKTKTVKVTTKVTPELAIINDKSLTVTEKVDKLLDQKQESKDYKDVGERVAGSKKERASIKAIFKYGDQAMFDEIMNKLGWEAVLETVDKAEILEQTGASDSVQKDYDAKVPASIAQFKKELIDSIYRVPKLAGKKSGKYSWDHYTYKKNEDGYSSLSKDELIEFAKVYPTTLKQLVTKILSIKNELPDELAKREIYTDALGNILDPKTEDYTYSINMKAFGFSDNYGKRISDRFKYANRGKIREGGSYYNDSDYEPATFNANDYRDILNPEKKEVKKSDDQHGNFEPIDAYDITDEDISKDKVKAENLTTEYGFKSVQLGNYMDDASSYEHIQQTMGAIESMSTALGIDLAKIISKRGLSIAYGARGGGKALAHYEPTKNIINMTKKRGDGSFGHEFMHFLDFTAPTLKKGKLSSLWSSGSRRYYREDEAGRKLMKALINGDYKTTETFSPNDQSIEDLIPSTMYLIGLGKHVDVDRGAVIDFLLKEYETNKNIANSVLQLDNEKYSLGYSDYYGFRISPQLLANITGDAITATVENRKSKFHELSKKYLGNGKDSYWNKNEELLARAFEAYLFDKLEEAGVQNKYAVRDNVAQSDTGVLAWAYPQGKEREAFNKLFDEYFSDIKRMFPLDDVKLKYKGEVIDGGQDTVTGAYLKDVSERLKIDFDWSFFDNIYGQSSEPAWGVTKKNAIGLAINAPFTTEHHEIVHLTLKNLGRIKALKHLNRADILAEQAIKMGLPIEQFGSNQVEEQLAIDFEQYIIGNKNSLLKSDSKIKQFFDFLKEQIAKMLKAIKLTNGSIVQEYFEILKSGKSMTDQYEKLSNGREFTDFIKGTTLDLTRSEDDISEGDTNLKKKLEDAKDKYNDLVKDVKKNKEAMEVISKYADKASLTDIVQVANSQVSEYVKAILEIQNIKKDVDDASSMFSRLVKQRENIEDLQQALESKISVINIKANNTAKRSVTPSKTVLVDAVIQEDEKGDTTEDIMDIQPTTSSDLADKMLPKGKKGKAISSFQHRMLDMLDEQNRDDVYYDRTVKVEEVAKFEKYYEANKKRTINMALEREPTPEGISLNVLSLGVIEKAQEQGDKKTVAKVLTKLTLRATEQGKEISMLRDAFGKNDPLTYMKKLIDARKALAKKRYKPFFSSTSDAKGVEDVVKERVKNARKKGLNLSEMMTVKAKQIDDFLNDITC